MFVRCKMRRKDGKEHRYWSVVENVRVRGGRVVQRQVLYLGEINDSQRAAWCRSIAVLDETAGARQLALFPAGRAAPVLDCEVVQIRVTDVQVRDPRQWGACWLALTVWDRLELDRFWGPRLPPSRKGTRWLDVLKVQVCYRLIDPGSDWRLHRQRIRPRWPAFWNRSNSNTAALSGSGSWTAASPPKRPWRPCARVTRPCATWWAPPRAA